MHPLHLGSALFGADVPLFRAVLRCTAKLRADTSFSTRQPLFYLGYLMSGSRDDLNWIVTPMSGETPGFAYMQHPFSMADARHLWLEYGENCATTLQKQCEQYAKTSGL